jgi:hypothetical protein
VHVTHARHCAARRCVELLPSVDVGITVFIPFDKTTYQQAATSIARRIAKLRNREHHGPPTLREHDLISECSEGLGRALAGGVIKSWGIVTVSWADQWNEYPLGEEIELRPLAWRTPDAKRRMTEPPDDGWMSGEIAYEGGRVIAVLESTDLDSHLKEQRRIATRYDKTATSFIGFVLLGCIRLRIRFVHRA